MFMTSVTLNNKGVSGQFSLRAGDFQERLHSYGIGEASFKDNCQKLGPMSLNLIRTTGFSSHRLRQKVIKEASA